MPYPKRYNNRGANQKPKSIRMERRQNTIREEGEAQPSRFARMGGAWKKKYGYAVAIGDEQLEDFIASLQSQAEQGNGVRFFLFWSRNKNSQDSPDLGVYVVRENGEEEVTQK